MKIWITYSEKSIFSFQNEDANIIFPELEHWMEVELDGKITRGNENTNSMGFLYQWHILNCCPEVWNITQYKEGLFLRCVINGRVDRSDKFWNIIENKPKIIFSSVRIIEDDDKPLSLF